MNIEVELKILEIDIKSIQEILKENGANRIGDKFFRRYVYDMNPKVDGKRLRLRTDGSKTTLACKQILNEKLIDGVNEREIVVDSFEECNELLNQMGFFHKAYQENKRESYELDGCEIEIDERPLIPPYLEIESDSKKKIALLVKKLGLEDGIITSENTTSIYKRYGIDNLDSYKELSFTL